MLAYNPGKFLLLSYFPNLSLRLLCALGVSAVDVPVQRKFTAETPSTQRKRRELKLGHHDPFCGKANREAPRMCSLDL